MIAVIEGPDKSGKTHLIDRILQGFEPDRSLERVKSSPDEYDGYGYFDDFIRDLLDKRNIAIWHRSWVSENIYGRLLKQDRQFARDPFRAEWFYTRALNGRGGNFILLPLSSEELKIRRNETDFPESVLSSHNEFRAYIQYAEDWGYEILLNDFTEATAIQNAVACRKSVYIPTHKISPHDYIGSLNPTYTFVGQVASDFEGGNLPFYSQKMADAFRIFGLHATRNFGYATIAGFEMNRRRYPKLFQRVIGVGGAIGRKYPELPNIDLNIGYGGRLFYEQFEHIAIKNFKWVPKRVYPYGIRP